MLALKTMFDPAGGAGPPESYELRFGEERFHMRVHDGTLAISRGRSRSPTRRSTPTRRRSLQCSGAASHSDEPAVARLRELFPLR